MPKKPELKSTAAPKRPAGKSKKKAAASVKTAAATTTTPNLVDPTLIPTFPLEEVSGLLDHHSLHALWSCLVRSSSSSPTLHTRVARPRAVLNNVILL